MNLNVSFEVKLSYLLKLLTEVPVDLCQSDTVIVLIHKTIGTANNNMNN